MPVRWLLKTEPSEYSWDDLVRDRRTVWTGIRNAQALIHLRNFRKGDLAVLYHTGQERAAVGLVKVVTAPYPDPAAGDPKFVVVDLVPQEHWKRPVPLAELKSDPDLANWDLLRISRLSIVPVDETQWKALHARAGGKTR